MSPNDAGLAVSVLIFIGSACLCPMFYLSGKSRGRIEGISEGYDLCRKATKSVEGRSEVVGQLIEIGLDPPRVMCR